MRFILTFLVGKFVFLRFAPSFCFFLVKVFSLLGFPDMHILSWTFTKFLVVRDIDWALRKELFSSLWALFWAF